MRRDSADEYKVYQEYLEESKSLDIVESNHLLIPENINGIENKMSTVEEVDECNEQH